MQSGRGRLSRNGFIKLAGLAAGLLLQASAGPEERWSRQLAALEWPQVEFSQLPDRIQRILRLTPHCIVDREGRLKVMDLPLKAIYGEVIDPSKSVIGKVPLVPTQWNNEHSHSWDRLDGSLSWGIVLHWFSEPEARYTSLESYLNGFNGLRDVDGFQTRTSAHFLVGDARPIGENEKPMIPIGILQMQAPDRDGTPFVASHLQELNYQQHHDKEQYFVRAMYELTYQDGSMYSLLQDFYDGRHTDPNMRTIAIEICGENFDNPLDPPCEQKIANVLGVIWALMRRYGIRASNLLGHNEISISKPDPGKKFMAFMRLLLGAKALVEDDLWMKELVFGQHLVDGRQPIGATQAFFRFLRNYLVFVSLPVDVYSWESDTSYWFIHDLISPSQTESLVAANFSLPIQQAKPIPICAFTVPPYHEGIDLIQQNAQTPPTGEACLTAPGTCLFMGESLGFHLGRMAIFRHRQPDGALVLSVYGQMDQLTSLQVGRNYPAGTSIGTAMHNMLGEKILHFAIAYGATWETDLRSNANIPLNAGTTWIQQRYLEPVQYLSKHLEQHEKLNWSHED